MLVVAQNTYACQTIQNMTDTVTLGRELAPYMEQSMKSIHLILSRQVTFMTMKHHALCVMSSHVVPNWWCPQGTTVHQAGTKSIMGIWWRRIMTTEALENSYVLTERQSMFLVVELVRMAHCCILYKEVVAPYLVFHTSMVGNWHAPFVLSEDQQYSV